MQAPAGNWQRNRQEIRNLPPLLAILPHRYASTLVRSWQEAFHRRTCAMMELSIAPDERTSAPVMISRLFESVKPMPQAAQPGGFALSASESLGFRHAAEPTGGAEGRYRFSAKARNESILCSEIHY